jgi:hypothetical protein
MILYLIYGFCMVTCTVSPLSRFTAQLLPVYLIVRIFHFCRNKNVRYRYLLQNCVYQLYKLLVSQNLCIKIKQSISKQDVHLCKICIYLNTRYISDIKSFLPVEAEISVTNVFITAKMKNSNYEVNRK